MSDLTPDPKDFEEDHYPVRGGDWLINDSGEIAQVKAIHLDHYTDDGKPEFLVDLYFYEGSGYKIGRKSDNEPFVIGDKTMRGPRTYEPCCSMVGWYRIKKPHFPLTRTMMRVQDPHRPGISFLRYEYDVPRRPWGNYGKRVRKPLCVVAVQKPNFDPELEKRVLLMTAQNLRDIARETGNEDLRQRAQDLEKKAEQF